MAYPTDNITDTKVDFIDDVLAQHINEPQGAIANMTLRHIKNTSGGAVTVGAVGYVDYAGEFKATATAYLDVTWAVVSGRSQCC